MTHRAALESRQDYYIVVRILNPGSLAPPQGEPNKGDVLGPIIPSLPDSSLREDCVRAKSLFAGC